MDAAVSDEGERGGKGAYGEIKGRVGCIYSCLFLVGCLSGCFRIVFQKFSSSFTPMQIIGNGFPDNLEGLAREKLNKVQNCTESNDIT